MTSGFAVSKTQAVIIIALMVVIVVSVGLMAGLIPNRDCPKSDGETSTTTSSPAPTTTSPPSTTPPEPAGPWQDPFLPSTTPPHHYDLWLYPDFYYNGDRFYGKVDIHMNVTKDTEYLIVHYKMMNITKREVKVDGNAVTVTEFFSYEANQYYVVRVGTTIKAGSQVQLTLEFNGSLKNGIVGFYKSTYVNTITGQESWLATSKFQPTDSRKAFPNYDEPQYKATYSITLKHWANFTALANMPAQSNKTIEQGWMETTFEKSVPMSSYLVCFIVCDFIYYENRLADGTPHRVWATPDKTNQTLYALDVGKNISDYFAREFDMDFHLPKLDQIAIPDFPSGAMEHWGLITYRETSLLYDPAQVSAEGKERVALVIAHELAHNFFGNSLTCKWWNEIWLNEGFARYFQYKGLLEYHPDWLVEDYFAVRTQQGVMGTDGSASSRPVIIEVKHPDEINQAFDGITYDKGGSMLRMMEDFMGSDRFRTAIRNYLKKYEFKSVVTPEFFAELQLVMGNELNIAEVLDPWFLQMGLPVVDISVSGNMITATPSRFLDNPDADPSKPDSPYDYKWNIPLTWQTPTDTGRVWLNKTSNSFADPRKAGEWLKFNNRQAIYTRINYPADMWKELTDQLVSNMNVFSPVDRASLVDDAFRLAAATKIDYPTALQLAAYLKDETQYFPWRSARTSLNYIGQMLYGHPDYNLWRKYVRNITDTAMTTLRVVDGGNHLEQMLRTDIISLACGNDHQECLQNVTRMFEWWIVQPNASPVPPNLRQRVYIFGMKEEGGEAEWVELWARYEKATSAQEKLYLLYALSQTKELWLIQRYLDYCMDENKVRTQDFFSAINYASYNPVGNLYVWNWARQNYDKLIARFSINDRYFGRMVPNIVTDYNTEYQLQEVTDFFAKYPDAGAGARPREQALESIRSNIEWLKMNEQTIIKWLKENIA